MGRWTIGVTSEELSRLIREKGGDAFKILFQKRIIEGDEEFTVEDAFRAVWSEAGDDVSRNLIGPMQRLFNRRPKDIGAEHKLNREVRQELKAEGKLPKGRKKKTMKDIQERARRWLNTNVAPPHPSDTTDDPFADDPRE